MSILLSSTQVSSAAEDDRSCVLCVGHNKSWKQGANKSELLFLVINMEMAEREREGM